MTPITSPAESRGYLALIDVLGFSALVSAAVGTKPLEDYLAAVEDALVNSEANGVEYVVFSDTIVLTAGDGEDAFVALVRECSRLFGVMLKRHIAIRGAIAHGTYFRRELGGHGLFVAGSAIVDAYHCEGQQDWAGIMIAPSVKKADPSLGLRCAIDDPKDRDTIGKLLANLKWAGFVRPWAIPYHDGAGEFIGHCVLPSDGSNVPENLVISLRHSIRDAEWLQSIAPDPAAQKKFKHTLTFLRKQKDFWEAVTARWSNPSFP